MQPIAAAQLARILNGALHGDPAGPLRGFATDSGSVQPGDLFIAIKGERVDGHDFADAAIRKGAVAVLAEREVGGPHILVDNVVEALANYGRHYRKLFEGPVVGVTGSAGKTTTKEFLAAALSPMGGVLKSTGNRNTEYTSPLVWSELNDGTRVAVIEMAMRGFGQIAHLASIASPTVGLVTNIGFAHLLQVQSREGIARAKGELLEALPKDGLAVIWHECPYADLLRSLSKAPMQTFGFDVGADCRIDHYEPIDWSQSKIHGVVGGKGWSATLPAAGRHVALDAAAAVLVAVSLGVDAAAAAQKLEGVVLPPMRMEVRNVRGATVLLDTYNASPPSVISAIETLGELPARGRRYAVLGEMRELGEHTESAHRQVGTALKEHRPDSVLFLGEAMDFARAEVGDALPSRSVAGLAEVHEFLDGLEEGDVVLIKGSRALELERALEGL